MAAPAGRQAKFVEGNLFRHIAVMSLTSSVGLMAIFAVDLINMIFISMLEQAEITAAVGYAGAILFFTTSFGIGLSIAVSALVARAVGQRDLVMAREKATNGLILGIGFVVVFSAVVWLFLPQIVSLLGATGQTHDLTVHFLRIVIPSQPFLMVGMIGGAILRSHGDAKRAMAATIWGALANAVLDPVLIFGLDLDLTGAAIASVVSRVVIAGVALLPILKHYGGFDRPTLAGLRSDLAGVFAIAGPAILTQVATPLGQAFVTRMVSGYGEAAVAGMAIAGRLTPVALGVIFALSGAVGPIIGQNYGAGRMDRGGDGCAVRAARADCRSVPCRRADPRSGLSVLRADLFAVFLQRRDFCGQCAVQQSWQAAAVDPDQLGAAHYRHRAFRVVAGGLLGRAGGVDRAGGGRCDLWCAGRMAGAAPDRCHPRAGVVLAYRRIPCRSFCLPATPSSG